MPDFAPPIEDYRFLLSEVLDFDAAMAELHMAGVDTDLAIGILEEGGHCVRNASFR